MFYAQFQGGDHLGVLLPPYADRIRGVVTGWLRWQLMSDTTLAGDVRRQRLRRVRGQRELDREAEELVTTPR